MSWYEDGVQFECTRCSRCCRHDPGFVFLTYDDLYKLTIATGLSEDAFVEKYCRKIEINGKIQLSLIEKSNYDCIFWEPEGCRVYEYRPFQCISYPFWQHYFTSREQWDLLRQSCPGVGRGKIHSREEIEQWFEERKKYPLIAPEREDII